MECNSLNEWKEAGDGRNLWNQSPIRGGVALGGIDPRDPSIFGNKIFLRGLTIIKLVAAALCVPCRLCLRSFDFLDQMIFVLKYICVYCYMI